MVHIYPSTSILYHRLINDLFIICSYHSIVWGGKGMRKVVTGVCEDEDMQGKKNKAYTENP